MGLISEVDHVLDCSQIITYIPFRHEYCLISVSFNTGCNLSAKDGSPVADLTLINILLGD